MKITSPTSKEFPLKIVGSSVYGRYNKISCERTYNMFISDNWLVPFMGYKQYIDVGNIYGDRSARIRGVYSSDFAKQAVIVVNEKVYSIDSAWNFTLLGTIDTSSGDVFMAENLPGKIAIIDGITQKIWLYNYNLITNNFQSWDPGFVPVSICFQDTYFICGSKDLNEFWLITDDGSFVLDAKYVNFIQTKNDVVSTCVPLPGLSGQLFVMGSNVTESWVNSGGDLTPYVKNTGYNIDYGCLNPKTVAYNDNKVVWVGNNIISDPVIMYSTGGEAKQISTDGISYKLSTINNYNKCYAFMFKEDGHLFYQLTFTDPNDNFTILYDFNTEKFFDLTDETEVNAHIAKDVFAFNNTNYFISTNDCYIYKMGSDITNYDGAKIPRIRITDNIRNRDSTGFIVNNLTFPIEQGNNTAVSTIELSSSDDSGVTFGANSEYTMNSLGNRVGKVQFSRLGLYTDFVARIQFYSLDRIVATDGIVEVSE